MILSRLRVPAAVQHRQEILLDCFCFSGPCCSCVSDPCVCPCFWCSKVDWHCCNNGWHVSVCAANVTCSIKLWFAWTVPLLVECLPSPLPFPLLVPLDLPFDQRVDVHWIVPGTCPGCHFTHFRLHDLAGVRSKIRASLDSHIIVFLESSRIQL